MQGRSVGWSLQAEAEERAAAEEAAAAAEPVSSATDESSPEGSLEEEQHGELKVPQPSRPYMRQRRHPA